MGANSTNTNDVPQSTDIKTNNACCNDVNCKDNNLATGNFFLPAGLRASIRRLSSMSMRNVFAADTDRCSIVRRVSARTLSSMAALDATVVQVAEEEDEEPISTVGRSHITAQGICCAVSISLYCFFNL